MMKRWSEPESVFAPLIAAVPPATDWAGYGNTLHAAAGSVPVAATFVKFKIANSFRFREGTRERQVLAHSGKQSQPFTARACLLHRMRDETGASPRTAYLWEVGLTHLKDGLCTPAVPADWDCALLQVTMYRLSGTGLAGAPQLALLRHLWAESVLAASPDAVVFGGAHHWKPEWWTENIAATVGERPGRKF
jgi:hypothetical protein